MSDLISEWSHDTYKFYTSDRIASIEMTRLRAERGGEIKAEIEVRWHGQPKPGLLHHGGLNLMSDRTVKTLSNTLQDRISEFDWYGFLTASSYLAKKRYREGDPPKILSDVEPDPVRWLLRPVVEYAGPTVIAAEGGSTKSLLALAIAATVATGRGRFLGMQPRQQHNVLYLDWEADEQTHLDRLQALCSGAGIVMPSNLYYRREWAPLADSADELARHVRELDVGLVVIDSKGMSLAGSPEDAQETIRMFGGLRKLNVPSIVVDHITNAAAENPKLKKRPFGSIYTQNVARNVWMARRLSQQPGEVTVLWEHTKSNNGRTGRKLAWRVEFVENESGERYEKIRIQPMNPIAAMGPMTDDQPLREKLMAVLSTAASPLEVAELAELTGGSHTAVRARLNEGRKTGDFVNVGEGATGRWLLAKDWMQSALARTDDMEDTPDPF